MGAHAELSPSSAHRWTVCTGSIAQIRKMGVPPNMETVHTRRGTCAHKVLDTALNTRIWPQLGAMVEGVSVDQQIIDGAKAAYDLLLPYTRLAGATPDGRPRWGAEQKLSIPTTGEYGTSDFWAHCRDTIIIADYKNGTHRVNAADNKQLLLYADGVVNMYVRRHGIKVKTLAMVIIQPNRPYRGNRIYDAWRVAPEPFAMLIAGIRADVRKIHEGKTQLIEGDHCHMCPAAPWNSGADTCPKHVAKAGQRRLHDPLNAYKDLLQ